MVYHGNQFSKIINSEMVILTPITINNHFNNANYVTKVDHLCSERHTFNFLLKKVDFRDGIWLLLIILNNNAIIFSYGIGGDLLLL